MSGPRIGVVLLAAGSARRFGSDKRFAQLGSGETLLGRSAAVLARVIEQRVLVIGRDDDPARFASLLAGWQVVVAEDSPLGMGASLAAAARRLPTHWDGCLVALADKPWLRAETVRTVHDALDDAIVVPRHAGEWGHPVGFPRRLFPMLVRLSGEAGARQLILEERARCCFLDVDDPGVLLDVDTPDALRAESPQLP